MSANSRAVDKSPLSFDVEVRRLPARGFPVKIDADAEARAALADAHGLESVDRLHAELLVERWGKDGAKVSGRVVADIVQSCIVTLEPVPATIDAAIDGVFVPENSRLAVPTYGEILVDPEGPDAPETFSGDSIDVGALVEEFFELAIDPYPRAPGAAFGESETGDGAMNPFAALAKLNENR
ncbi:MAG: DUF177 domain-containing protein [Phyllobacteriaceae bacterium]|nr:DUF177 domain-containing protein [Phyllobacteriaceae bacterium]